MAKRATPDGIGKRVPLMARTTIALRASLAAAAAESGLSLAQEVERRLEMSFAEDRMRAIAREEIAMARREDASAASEGFRRLVENGPTLHDRIRAMMGRAYNDNHPNGGQ